MKKLVVMTMTGMLMFGLTACAIPSDYDYPDDPGYYENQPLEDETYEEEPYEEETGAYSENSDEKEMIADYEGEGPVFMYSLYLYADSTYDWYADGGAEDHGTYSFEGDTLTTTSNDGTEKVYTVTGEDEITDADGTVYVSTKG